MPILIPLPTNSIVQLSIFSTLFDQRIINTCRFQFTGVPDPAVDYRQYLGAMSAQLEIAGGLIEDFKDTYPTNLTVQWYRLQPIWPTRLRYMQFLVGAGGTSSFAEARTANLAASIRRVSDVIGPGGVGRVQIPVPEATVANGKLDVDYMNSELTDLANELKQPVVTGAPAATWTPVLFGKNAAGLIHTGEIIDASPEDTVRTMHRRTLRLGE